MTKQPISIYEVHLGSWKKKDREEKDGYYTYVEAAHELAAYVKEMGYTHVELMGIAELHMTVPGDIRLPVILPLHPVTEAPKTSCIL